MNTIKLEIVYSIEVTTDDPSLQRRAHIINFRQHLKDAGVSRWMNRFVERFPQYAGKEALVKRVYLLRQDDLDVYRCFAQWVHELKFQDHQKTLGQEAESSESLYQSIIQ